MGRPRKNPELVQTNSDLPEEEMDVKDQTIIALQGQVDHSNAMMQMMADRLSRLEAVSSQNKLRKWDEMNDADALQKRGFVPSMDGKDPIVSIIRGGKAWITEAMVPMDEQFFKLVTQSGVEKTIGLLECHALCGGNEIPCVVNDWDALLVRQKEIDKKRVLFQRSGGKTAKVNTVQLLKEIKEEESALMVNVTLSQDMGKSFTGPTLDIPFQTVFNAWL